MNRDFADGQDTILSIRLFCLALHALLFFSESDVHLFQGYLVQRPRDLQSFRLLILAQAFTGRLVQLSDTLLDRIKSGVVVIGRANDGKASLIVRTSDDLTKRVPAGQVIKELAPIIGGRGGGKADMAEGGGNQPEKLAEALEASYGVIERMLG